MAPTPLPLRTRLEAKYIPEPNTGCWLWIGSLDRKGYGQFSFSLPKRRTKTVRAHRAVYEMIVGPIPDGLGLDHKCRVPSCVNPDHLEPVTQRENVLRGRGFAAVHAKKTHCIRGHELKPRAWSHGHSWRYCRTCATDRENARARRIRVDAQVAI